MPMKIAMTTPNRETAVSPKIDDDQLLDFNRNLAHENGCSREQQGEGDQVVEYAVAHGFAESVGGNVGDTGSHALLPTLVSACRSFSTK